MRPSTLGRWSAAHPRVALAAWLAFVGAALAVGQAVGTKELENGAVGDSARGYTLIDRHRLWQPTREFAYLHSDSLTTDDHVFRRALDQVWRRAVSLPGLNVSVAHSADRHSALVVMELRGFVPLDRMREVASPVPGASAVTIAATGDISVSEARNRVNDRDLQRAEYLSVPVTLLVLLFAFGSLVAAVVPVLLAITAVAAAIGLLGPISRLFPAQDSATIVMVLIGMAVGVDYALFYVVRSREERRKGASSHEALATTARTSGRTVLVSGTTVAIAMAGIFVVRAKVLDAVAAATITVVACAVTGSVTALPAALELLGSRIDRGRIPFLPHLETEGSPSRFWTGVVDRVLRRPLVFCLAATAILLALAPPALSLHVTKPSDNALVGASEPAARVLASVQRDFPAQAASRAIVVVEAPPAARAAAVQQLGSLRRLAVAAAITREPVAVTVDPAGAAALWLPLSGNGSDPASRRALSVLRDELVPRTVGSVPGATALVTGDTAEDVDFTAQMRDGVPYVIAFVLVLAFVLLLLAFRSIVVPLKAILLNLLAVAASCGVVVAVFQHHWAEPILRFHSDGAVISWLPLFLFVILFGLSMDYHVFILSRVREAVDGGLTTEQALRHSIPATAGVVTSAALVMVGVFALFGTLTSLDVKQAGVGLGTAVLLDATIVRAVLLPSTMALLGDRNWYLPRFLRRLPGG